MARLVIFDKDGVVLDLQATWLPVARAVAAYTASLIPSNGPTPQVTTADLLRAIGVDDAVGHIDPKGIFATGSFAHMRTKWQAMLPQEMIALDHDRAYRNAVKNIVYEHTRQSTKAKGDVVTPLKALYQDGFQLAMVTNDSEASARQSLHDLGICLLYTSPSPRDATLSRMPSSA